MNLDIGTVVGIVGLLGSVFVGTIGIRRSGASADDVQVFVKNLMADNEAKRQEVVELRQAVKVRDRIIARFRAWFHERGIVMPDVGTVENPQEDPHTLT